MASTSSPTTSSISCCARLPDAPAGTRGISLFLVPKFFVNADGSLGARNDVLRRIHRAQDGHPRVADLHDDLGDKGGAVGYLVGEENRGLACMFTMMNQARLVGRTAGRRIADRATQQAFAYARERKQGRAPPARNVRAERRSSIIPTSSACCSP